MYFETYICIKGKVLKTNAPKKLAKIITHIAFQIPMHYIVITSSMTRVFECSTVFSEMNFDFYFVEVDFWATHTRLEEGFR